jgi:hypothetical protein
MEKHICIFVRLVVYETYVLLLKYAYMLVFSRIWEVKLVYGCNWII